MDLWVVEVEVEEWVEDRSEMVDGAFEFPESLKIATPRLIRHSTAGPCTLSFASLNRSTKTGITTCTINLNRSLFGESSRRLRRVIWEGMRERRRGVRMVGEEREVWCRRGRRRVVASREVGDSWVVIPPGF